MWTKVTTRSAVAHEGECLNLCSEEYLKSKHGLELLRALLEEFGENPIVFLDRAPNFSAKAFWEFVSSEPSIEYIDDTSVDRTRDEPLWVRYFPLWLPELNPIEQC